MPSYRLSSGGCIDRSKPVTFLFDGKRYTGFAGDSLASALLANDIQLLGRSFKYHRPRGIVGKGTEEPNALVTVRTEARQEPNIQATMVEIFDGLVARSQNRWPTLRWDLQSANSLAAPLFAAGFYYKTFMGPTKRSWMLFEPAIRRAAGLGEAPTLRDPDDYDKWNHFCDVAVVGAGPAGLAAALTAVRAGARVTLADENAEFGGSLRGAQSRIGDGDAATWVRKAVDELTARGATLLTRTTAFGYYDGQNLGMVQRVADHLQSPAKGSPRQRFWNLRAREIILAAGSVERPLVFPGNDRPGVMLAETARHLAEYQGVACGRKVAVFTNNDSAYEAARVLHRCGVDIAVIVELRAKTSSECDALVHEIGCRRFLGAAVRSTRGRHRLRAVSVSPLQEPSQTQSLDVDCLLISGGWSPAVHLATQLGSASRFDERISSFVPGSAAANASWLAAGAMNGAFDTASCISEGTKAGVEAARKLGFDAIPDHVTAEISFTGYDPIVVPEIFGSGKAFVDLQNDVTTADIRLSQKEGYRSIEHTKRYTTLGMATDQGRTSNVNAISLIAEIQERPVAQIGMTRFRSPCAPVALGVLAGRHRGQHYQPVRRTPMQEWHERHGGVMSPIGPWLRPRAYLRAGETLRGASIREASTVRNAVGICDVSTLGKIDIQGPDAAIFLDRVYANNFLKLPVGKARYGVMLREDGMVLDDGTSWRLGETQFLMTTSTGNAGPVMSHLEKLLSLHWPELRVTAISTTSQWAGMSVAGPHARDVLRAAMPHADLGDGKLPFMGLLKSTIGGAPVVVARLSFSGEMAYEVFCGADHGLGIWGYLLAVGADHGITPYGTEALNSLRIEKGHVAGGELDGRVSPFNLGLGGMLSKTKDFVGSRLIGREGLHDPERYELVGLVSTTGRALQNGSHIVESERAGKGPSLGYISSSTFGAAVKEEIGLALVKGGASRIGRHLYAANPVRAEHVPVKLVKPAFFDPDGSRMRG